ncbi:MAG: protein kinase [Gemmatimonadales bacterium]
MGDISTDLLSRIAASISDRYRVDRLLGEGGMAMVYHADDLRHHRAVAIKVLKPVLTEAVGSERFLREINTSARLNHPHILPLLDSGTAGDLLFYVMPFVDGESLRDRLERDGPFPLEEAIRIVAEIADGLAYAHRAGVVHRDVKPENIMLSSGHAVITDFGVARALDAAGDARLTQTGGSTGTPYYMSPEQWDTAATNFDGRSDQYALGCVAFEILTGARPFSAPTAMALMLQHLSSPIPSVRKFRPDVPEHVDVAIRTALAKVPEHRFSTTDGLAAALRSPSAPVPAPPPAPTPSRNLPRWLRPTVPKVAALAVLLTLGAYAGFKMRPGGNASLQGKIGLAVLPFQNQGMSSDAYFADGIADDITNRLASVSRLKVIDRRSTAKYRGSNKTTREIGDDLNVDYLVEGTVRWDGSTQEHSSVRVTAQLVSVSNGVVLLPYDTTAPTANVFAIQAGIAQRVTEKLTVALLPPERRRLQSQDTLNMEAYRAYLQGNSEYQRSWSRKSVEAAIGSFDKAVALEPDYALAWAKLGWMHCWMNQLGLDLSEERLVKAKAAVDRALALDSSLAEAHVALGLYWYWGRDDYDKALFELTRAAELEPSYAEASHQIGNVRRRQGRFSDAIANYRMSADLNPVYGLAWYTLGETLLIVRDYDEAAKILARASELAPDHLEAYLQQARVAISARGDIETARRVLTVAEERIPPAEWRAPMIHWMRIVNGQNLQTYLDRLRPNAYGLDSATYHLVKARFFLQMRERNLAIAEFDSARGRYEHQRDDRPGDALTHAALGEIYAGLARPVEAVASARRAVELIPVSRDALDGPEMLVNLANVYVMTGDADSAAAYYYRALSVPSYFSLNLLRADPLLASFVSTRQFEEMARKLAAGRAAASLHKTEYLFATNDELKQLSWTFALSRARRLRTRGRRRRRGQAR